MYRQRWATESVCRFNIASKRWTAHLVRQKSSEGVGRSYVADHEGSPKLVAVSQANPHSSVVFDEDVPHLGVRINRTTRDFDHGKDRRRETGSAAHRISTAVEVVAGYESMDEELLFEGGGP